MVGDLSPALLLRNIPLVGLLLSVSDDVWVLSVRRINIEQEAA